MAPEVKREVILLRIGSGCDAVFIVVHKKHT